MNSLPFDTIVLASQSSRRKWFLESAALHVLVKAANIDETPMPDEDPTICALRLAQEKLKTVHDAAQTYPTLAADTMVTLDGILLGKPESKPEAIKMLRFLSGQTHRVITAVAIAWKEKQTLFSVETKVRFRELNDDDIEQYLHKEHVYDKAGGYAIQSGAAIIDTVEGSFSNIIGLPLRETLDALGKISAS